jgi:protein-S-isoprenylcysteine O-methyltransferase Ste14
MTYTAIAVVVALVGLVVLFLLWRTLKFVLRLALAGLVLLAVVAGLFAWGWFAAGDSRRPRPRAANANARRAN